jgi:YidC/Oxa1 family membrane protein insertase
MEKRQIAFLVICIAVLGVWMAFFNPRKPKPKPDEPAPPAAEEAGPAEAEQAPTQETAETAEPAEQPESAGEAEAAEPDTEPSAELAAEQPQAEQVTAEVEPVTDFEPVLYSLANAYATFEISTRGGVVRQVTLETKQTSSADDIVIHGAEEYAFCPDGVPQHMYPLAIHTTEPNGLDLAEVEFKKVEDESGDRTLVLRYGTARFAVTKTFTLPEKGYRLDVQLSFRNKTDAWLALPEYAIEVGSVHPIDAKQRRGETRITVDTGSVRKLTPAVEKKAPRDEPVSVLRWAAISNKYFAAILDARGAEGTGEIKARRVVSDIAFLRFATEKKKRKVFATDLNVTLPNLTLRAGEEHLVELKLYIGPKEYTRLRPLGYVKVMGTTYLATLAEWLMVVLSFVYGLIPNYGVAIILLTAAVKLVLFPLDRRSFKSMREMQKIQPLIKQLQAKYKDDKRQLQIEQMKLFKEHKVNPLGGCFPILLQFPVLIGMFTMLRNAVELWRAPFVGYVNDLSAPDTLFAISGFEVHVLPILMTIFTILSQRLRGQAQATDPQQKMMTQLMPIVFLFIFYTFPSGLNLYWLCSTVFSFAGQLAIRKKDETA